MTEAEWLVECSESQQMLWPLQDTAKVTRTKAGRRKCRLFACACARLLWEHLHDPRPREAVEVSEKYAEGLAPKEELASARKRIEGLNPGSFDGASPAERTAAWLATSTTEEKAFYAAVNVTALPEPLGGYVDHQAVDEAILCGLLRCLFCNPFRPLPFDPALRTATVVSLARAAYAERGMPGGELDPARLAVLADALEEAGAAGEMLDHLRVPGPHPRGCWAVDACLGKG
jgi:hypothetical protein